MDGWIMIKENMSTDREGEDVYDALPPRVNISNYGVCQRGLSGPNVTNTEIEDKGAALIQSWVGA